MKVLFVTSIYLPEPTPPGVCIMNIQGELLKKGVGSDVLMLGENYGEYGNTEFGKAYSIKADMQSYNQNYKVEKKRRYIQCLKSFLSWPITNYKYVTQYKNYISELDSINNYEAIIATVLPLDAAFAAAKVTSEKLIVYELDAISNNPMYKMGIKKFLRHRALFCERFLFDHSKMILHLENNRNHFENKRYERYKKKFQYVDIPNLVKRDCADIKSGKKIVLVYTGKLYKSFRSPEYIADLVSKLPNFSDIVFEFYSRGDCDSVLKAFERKTEGQIVNKGYVSQEELDGVFARADFLVDIGNNLSGEDKSLPSKVFEYMSIGKPIIHIDGGENDIVKDYLDKYSLYINLSKDNNEKDNISKLYSFICKNKGVKIEYDEICGKFEKNCPKYTADCIYDSIGGV